MMHFFFINVAHAYELVYKFPGLPETISGPSEYIQTIYKFGLGLVGLFGFGALVWGGIQYIISGDNIAKRMDARGQIRDALLGILLLAGSVLLLNEINPQILRTGLETLEEVRAPLATPETTPNSAEVNALAATMRAWRSPNEGNTDDTLTRFLALDERDRQLVLAQLDERSRGILEEALRIRRSQDETLALIAKGEATVKRIQSDAAYRTQLQSSIENRAKTLTAEQRQTIENLLAQFPNATQGLQANFRELDRRLQDPALRTIGGTAASDRLQTLLRSLNLTEEEALLIFQTSSPADLSRLLGTGATAQAQSATVATGGTTDPTRFGVGGALRALPQGTRDSLTSTLQQLSANSTVAQILNSPWTPDSQRSVIRDALSRMSLTNGDSLQAMTPKELLDLISRIK